MVWVECVREEEGESGTGLGVDVISFLLCSIARGNHVRSMKEKGQATWEQTEGEEERGRRVVALRLECWTGGGEEEREEEGEENGYRTVIAFRICSDSLDNLLGGSEGERLATGCANVGWAGGRAGGWVGGQAGGQVGRERPGAGLLVISLECHLCSSTG